jgi:RNA polymerase sigma-70 factor (ECF subfamily)
MKYLPGYQSRGRFKSWISRIIRNQCLMEIRSRGYQDRLLQTLTTTSECAAAATAGILPELRRAIARLSPDAQEVLFLRFGAQLSHKEIAEMLDIPVGTVKSRVSNTRKRLRQLLECNGDMQRSPDFCELA